MDDLAFFHCLKKDSSPVAKETRKELRRSAGFWYVLAGVWHLPWHSGERRRENYQRHRARHQADNSSKEVPCIFSHQLSKFAEQKLSALETEVSEEAVLLRWLPYPALTADSMQGMTCHRIQMKSEARPFETNCVSSIDDHLSYAALFSPLRNVVVAIECFSRNCKMQQSFA